jgi:hypothetical protein
MDPLHWKDEHDPHCQNPDPFMKCALCTRLEHEAKVEKWAIEDEERRIAQVLHLEQMPIERCLRMLAVGRRKQARTLHLQQDNASQHKKSKF